MKRFVLVLSVVGLWSVAPAVAEDVAAGKAFVEKNCGSCHAVGKTGSSPLAAAPAFRDVFKNYPPSDLEEALAEGIITGHPEMPEWQLDPPLLTDVIAYLETIAP